MLPLHADLLDSFTRTVSLSFFLSLSRPFPVHVLLFLPYFFAHLCPETRPVFPPFFPDPVLSLACSLPARLAGETRPTPPPGLAFRPWCFARAPLDQSRPGRPRQALATCRGVGRSAVAPAAPSSPSASRLALPPLLLFPSFPCNASAVVSLVRFQSPSFLLRCITKGRLGREKRPAGPRETTPQQPGRRMDARLWRRSSRCVRVCVGGGGIGGTRPGEMCRTFRVLERAEALSSALCWPLPFQAKPLWLVERFPHVVDPSPRSLFRPPGRRVPSRCAVAGAPPGTRSGVLCALSTRLFSLCRFRLTFLFGRLSSRPFCRRVFSLLVAGSFSDLFLPLGAVLPTASCAVARFDPPTRYACAHTLEFWHRFLLVRSLHLSSGTILAPHPLTRFFFFRTGPLAPRPFSLPPSPPIALSLSLLRFRVLALSPRPFPLSDNVPVFPSVCPAQGRSVIVDAASSSFSRFPSFSRLHPLFQYPLSSAATAPRPPPFPFLPRRDLQAPQCAIPVARSPLAARRTALDRLQCRSRRLVRV